MAPGKGGDDKDNPLHFWGENQGQDWLRGDAQKALERENVKTDSNHVPISVDAYTVGDLKEWLDDRDLAQGCRPQVPPTDEQNDGADLSRCCF